MSMARCAKCGSGNTGMFNKENKEIFIARKEDKPIYLKCNNCNIKSEACESLYLAIESWNKQNRDI